MSRPAATGRRRPRNPRGRGQQLAADILAAGQQIIEDTGDESRVTLSEIARRVGIAVPSIYDHFAGADDICRHVVAHAWHVYYLAITEGNDPQAAVRDQIADFAYQYVAFARKHWGMYRVLYSRSEPSPMPDTGHAARDSFSRLVDGFAHILGVDASSTEAWDSAVGLWIQLHGIASLPPAHPRFDWPNDERLIDAALHRSGLR